MKLDTKTCSLFSKRNHLPIFDYQRMVYALKCSNEVLLRDIESTVAELNPERGLDKIQHS